MGQRPGQTGNKNGRPKNALTKISGDLRTRITNFLQENWQDVEAEYKKLNGRDKLLFVKDLLPYASPRLAASQVDMMMDVSNLSEDELDSVIKKMLETVNNECQN
jgi:hypothetical protein